MLTLESWCWDEVSFSEGLSLMLENQSKVLQSYRICILWTLAGTERTYLTTVGIRIPDKSGI